MSQKRPLWLVSSASVLVLLVLLLIGSFFGGKDDDADSMAWDRATRGRIRETVTASGEIQARTRVHIGTNITAEIKRICVVDGQMVKAGDLLVVLDRERAGQQLLQGRALLDASIQDANRSSKVMEKARDTFRRQESLFKGGLISEEDYRQGKLTVENAELACGSARANVVQARANLGVLQDGVDKCEIRAPINGRVTGLKAERGEIAIPGTSNLPGATLMIVSDMNELVSEVNISEGEIVRIKLGQQASITVDSFPGKNFIGTVIERATISEKVGSSANLYRVKVLLDPRTEGVSLLLPGMSSRCTILTNEASDILKVPMQAVLEKEETEDSAQRKGVFMPEKHLVVMRLRGNDVEEVPVVTGLANTKFIEIKNGLKDGDKVIIGPLRKLKALKDKSKIKCRAKAESDQDVHRTMPKVDEVGAKQ